MSVDLLDQAGWEAAKVAPPLVVSVIALIAKGLPFVISLLTLIYLSVQIAYLLRKWLLEERRKRAIDKAFEGPVAGYKPRIPK